MAESRGSQSGGGSPRKTPASSSFPKASSPPPSQRKVPWGRRLVSTAVLTAVVVGLLFGVGKLAGWVTSLLGDTHAQTTESAAVKPVDISPCASTDLQVSLTPSAAVVEVGSGMVLSVVITNAGESDCSVDTADVAITLAGGSGTVWEPTECGEGWARPLLLSPGQSWSGQLEWDGLVHEGCTGEQSGAGMGVAPAGVYTVTGEAPGWTAPVTASVEVR